MRIASLLAGVILLSGCQSAYYSAMEGMGFEKREILASRVEKARDAQQDAEVEFRTAQQQLAELIGFEGAELEEVYDRTRSAYEASDDAAEQVSERIDAVDSVANALFSEWQQELEQYSNARLRRDSEQKLRSTKQQYQQLITTMRQAESKMAPVLSALNDNVLYLKHNLNARTLGSLEGEYRDLSAEIDQLIRQMQQAIVESDAFLASL